MTIDEFRARLRQAQDDWSDDSKRAAMAPLVEMKRKAVADGNQQLAKEIWALQEAAVAQRKYISAFQAAKREAFYEAWTDFEQVELALGRLERHLDDGNDDLRTKWMRQKVQDWQSLFPYAVFMSPEILEEEKKCSICGAVVSPRRPCGHRVGEIYNGEHCGRIVTKIKFLGMAHVTKPVQKYSVPFIDGKDHYDYSAVDFVAKRLSSPFDDWSVERTRKRHPHERYRHIGRNDPCPCDSGIKYKKCCLPQPDGVLRPHIQIQFAKAIPQGMSHFECSRMRK